MSGVHGNISHAMRDNYAEFGVDEVSDVCSFAMIKDRRSSETICGIPIPSVIAVTGI
jgi:hypothetical protein